MEALGVVAVELVHPLVVVGVRVTVEEGGLALAGEAIVVLLLLA